MPERSAVRKLNCSRTHEDFERFGGGMRGELDGFCGFFQGKTMGDQAADVELAGEDEAGDFLLQGEIGGVAAEEVLFINADAR